MFRLFFSSLLWLLMGALPIQSAVYFELPEFEYPQFQAEMGYVNIDGHDYFKTGFSPHFQFGAVGIGIDLNLYTAFQSGHPLPRDLHTIALRQVTYDYYGDFGIKWERLQNVTFGHGLLVDDYDSGSFGSTQFNTSKAGFQGYLEFMALRLDALYTASGVIGGRIAYSHATELFLGAPLILGATYMLDMDGIEYTIDGTSSTLVSRPRQGGFATDISIPLGGDFLVTYIEYAQLNDDGKGTVSKGGTAGIRGDFFDMFGYRFEYRQLGSGFVPGYFNRDYERTSFNFETDTHTHQLGGFFYELFGTFFDGHIKTGAHVEIYEDHPSLFTTSLGWQRLGPLIGVINYSFPFQGKQHQTLNVDLRLDTDNFIDYMMHFRKTFLPNGVQSDAYSISARINLDRFISGL